MDCRASLAMGSRHGGAVILTPAPIPRMRGRGQFLDLTANPVMPMHQPLHMLKRFLLFLLGSIVLGSVAYLQIFWP
jgi:hypothetical protein